MFAAMDWFDEHRPQLITSVNDETDDDEDDDKVKPGSGDGNIDPDDDDGYSDDDEEDEDETLWSGCGAAQRGRRVCGSR